MSEMKNIVESWREYVSEQEDPDEEQVSSDEIETVGQLRTALKNYKIKKTGQGVLTKVLRKGVEAIPVAGPAIGAVLDAGELAKSLYGGDLDDKEPLPGLAAMRVNSDVSKIVDDDIEEEFLKVLSQELEDIKSSTLQRCAQKQYNSVIFDLSAVELIDLSEWEALRKLNQCIKLMGPDSWFVGLRTDLIITLISLDAKTQDLNYALGVEEALTESLG